MWNFLKKYNGCDVNKFIDDAKIETKRAKKGDLSKFKLVEQGAAMEFRWKIYNIKVRIQKFVKNISISILTIYLGPI